MSKIQHELVLINQNLTRMDRLESRWHYLKFDSIWHVSTRRDNLWATWDRIGNILVNAWLSSAQFELKLNQKCLLLELSYLNTCKNLHMRDDGLDIKLFYVNLMSNWVLLSALKQICQQLKFDSAQIQFKLVHIFQSFTCVGPTWICFDFTC